MVRVLEIIKTPFEGLYLFQPKVFGDERGYFFESFNQRIFNDLTGSNHINFVQDNQSMSQKDVLRGMHFQVPPNAQAKLVRVIRGAVLDVVVDLRKDSPQFGKHFSVKITDENHTQLYIPEGFAHGFLTLEDHTVFSYKCTGYYHQESEVSLKWDDKDLDIDWKLDNPIVSAKDQAAISFNKYNSPL